MCSRIQRGERLPSKGIKAPERWLDGEHVYHFNKGRDICEHGILKKKGFLWKLWEGHLGGSLWKIRVFREVSYADSSLHPVY